MGHDVSNLLGAGRHLGSLPDANTSITIMRAPQRGHGQGSTRGASGVISGCCCGSAAGGATSRKARCQCSPKRDPGCASKRDPAEGARGVVPRHPELDPLPHEERRPVVVVRLREGLSTESIGGTRARCGAPSRAAERRAWEVPVDPRGQARLIGFCPVRSRRRCFSPRSIATRSRERSCAGSISAEAARRNDGMKFGEVEVADRVQCLGGDAVL